MTQPTCPHCRVLLPANAKFCTQCAAAVSPMHASSEAGPRQGGTVPYTIPGASPPAPTSPGRKGEQDWAPRRMPARTHPYTVAQNIAAEPRITIVDFDQSTSMASLFHGANNKMEAAQQAGIRYIGDRIRINANDQIGIVSFDHHGHFVLPVTPLTGNLPRIISAVRSIRNNGGTNLDEGLRAAESLLKPVDSSAHREIILLTDGCGGNPRTTADRLKHQGVVLHTVGIGSNGDRADVNETLLRSIASIVNGQPSYCFLESSPLLTQHFSKLATQPYTHG